MIETLKKLLKILNSHQSGEIWSHCSLLGGSTGGLQFYSSLDWNASLSDIWSHIFFFGQIQSCKTGEQLKSDTLLMYSFHLRKRF